MIELLHDPEIIASNSTVQPLMALVIASSSAIGQLQVGKEIVFVLKCNNLENFECKDFDYSVVGFSQGLCSVREDSNGDDILSCGFIEETPVSKRGSLVSSKHIIRGEKTFKSFKEKLIKKSKGLKQ